MAHLGSNNASQVLTIVAGAPQTLAAAEYALPYPLTLHITPGVGDSVTVEQRGSATGEFHNIPVPTATPGVFSAYDVVRLDGGVEALQFTAAVANGTVEICQ